MERLLPLHKKAGRPARHQVKRRCLETSIIFRFSLGQSQSRKQPFSEVAYTPDPLGRKYGYLVRTSLPYCRPSGTLVNQGKPFKMKDSVTRPADVKRGKLPRKTSGNPYGALAQLVARDIRIVEVRGSTPLCSTRNLADQSLQGFFVLVFRRIGVCRSCTRFRSIPY